MEDSRDRSIQELLAEIAQKRDRIQVELEQEREKTRPLDIYETLCNCHDLLQLSLKLPTSPALGTKELTTVVGEVYPINIKECNQLRASHTQYNKKALQLLSPDDSHRKRCFSSLEGLKHERKKLVDKTINSEKDLEYWLAVATEDHVAEILVELCKLPEAQKQLGLKNKLLFGSDEGHLRPEDTDRGRFARTPPRQIGTNGDSAPRTPYTASDRVFVERTGDDTYKLMFPMQYKPPHKVTAELLRAGLKLRDIKAEILQNNKQPAHNSKKRPLSAAETKEKFENDARRDVASILTQIFDKMITSGAQFGYLTTGAAFLWLQVPEDDPTAVNYYLSVPGEMGPSDQSSFKPEDTAVSQVLGWCLMVLASERRQRDQDWVANAYRALSIFQTDDNDRLANIEESPENLEKPSPYRGSKRAKNSQGGCNDSPATARDPNDPDDRLPRTPRKFREGPAPKGTRQIKPRNPSSSKTAQDKQPTNQESMEKAPYCTQACLQGLAQGFTIDCACPNSSLHRPTASQRHSINTTSLVSLLYLQLKERPCDGCYPLGIMGRCGYLFKMALLSHGYVFVAKGTIAQLVPSLLHEARVYQHLAPSKALPSLFT